MILLAKIILKCMLIISFYYYINFPSFQMTTNKLSILAKCMCLLD